MGRGHAAMGRHARQQVTAPRAEMIDVVFEMSGGTLPVAYPYALWDELVRLIPLLGDNQDVGVIPLRMAESNEGMLLPKRAKLVLRLPQELVDVVSGLAQQQMRVAGSELRLGSCKTRPIQHYSTLHAQLVTGADDEVAFVAEVESALAAMGVKAKLICGQHRIAGRCRAHDQRLQPGVARPHAGRLRCGCNTPDWARNDGLVAVFSYRTRSSPVWSDVF